MIAKTTGLAAKFFYHLPALAVTFFLFGCGGNNSEMSAKDEEEITAISHARAKAFNEGNAAGIADHFTDDAYLMAPGKPVSRGRDAVRKYYQAIFDQYKTSLESHYEEVEVSGDLAYGRGFAKVILYPKSGGDSLLSTAKYLNILKKQADGTWKTTHDVWNNNE